MTDRFQAQAKLGTFDLGTKCACYLGSVPNYNDLHSAFGGGEEKGSQPRIC